jgi:hypothetical protein
MANTTEYQAINVTKDNALEDRWAVVRLAGNEIISHHDSEADALAAIKSYRAEIARRSIEQRETRT